MIPSFRVSGHFPRFRLLGFGLIFRRSAIPSFRLLGSPQLEWQKVTFITLLCFWNSVLSWYKLITVHVLALQIFNMLFAKTWEDYFSFLWIHFNTKTYFERSTRQILSTPALSGILNRFLVKSTCFFHWNHRLNFWGLMLCTQTPKSDAILFVSVSLWG